MTLASHARGPEFDPRSSYDIRSKSALLVQWLEYAVANGVARVRFPDSAVFANFILNFFRAAALSAQLYFRAAAGNGKKKFIFFFSFFFPLLTTGIEPATDGLLDHCSTN